MCRNIRTLFNFKPPATEEEIRAAALQFVRKLSGFNAPSKANAAAFERAIDEVAEAARTLIGALVTTAEPRDRDVEAARARERAAARFGMRGAIVLESGYGEIKRMYVMPEERGRGIARALLRFLEEAAAARGVASFALETGNRQHEAIALYEHAGYVNCEPFGEYQPDPHSVFMRKDRAA